ncbi:hypothetical protein sync_2690 [Synechococcus sp. CC9311]|nr:hypothetical protein sync_2690 [Synechococcus sp. CC9311]
MTIISSLHLCMINNFQSDQDSLHTRPSKTKVTGRK